MGTSDGEANRITKVLKNNYLVIKTPLFFTSHKHLHVHS